MKKLSYLLFGVYAASILVAEAICLYVGDKWKTKK